MNPKKEKFCIEYLRCGNQQVAASLAGYASPNAGNRLVKRDPEVKARLAELKKEVERNAIADIIEVKTKLTAILRQEAEEEVLLVEGRGVGLTEAVRYNKKADTRASLKAAELLAKMDGAFSDIQVGVGVQVIINDDLENGDGEVIDGEFVEVKDED